MGRGGVARRSGDLRPDRSTGCCAEVPRRASALPHPAGLRPSTLPTRGRVDERPATAPLATLPLVGRVGPKGRGGAARRSGDLRPDRSTGCCAEVPRRASALPHPAGLRPSTLPTRGRVDERPATAPLATLPLVGRVGPKGRRGVARRSGDLRPDRSTGCCAEVPRRVSALPHPAGLRPSTLPTRGRVDERPATAPLATLPHVGRGGPKGRGGVARRSGDLRPDRSTGCCAEVPRRVSALPHPAGLRPSTLPTRGRVDGRPATAPLATLPLVGRVGPKGRGGVARRSRGLSAAGRHGSSVSATKRRRYPTPPAFGRRPSPRGEGRWTTRDGANGYPPLVVRVGPKGRGGVAAAGSTPPPPCPQPRADSGITLCRTSSAVSKNLRSLRAA
ncbi:hypothetical protein OHA_1_01018 [Pleomorphomonas sp. SM30]|nr:hypothetical protein OHA_1_01018 [Pleomorphomonas sp. SM30]